MSLIDELQAAIENVAATAGPSVVGIGRHHRGSGVVVGDGRVLTNAHNIRGDEVTVTFADGRSVLGSLAGIDVDGDLAVVNVDTAGAGAPAWGAGDGLTVGQAVFGAAASPSGSIRVTFGTVSAVARAFRGPGGRRITGSVEHTAPLASGSSGGPLLDADGRFVGLNTNRLGEGFYLALPADAALRERVDALGRGESAQRPRLGVAVAPAHVARRLRLSVGLPERDGLLVRGVEDGSPAARAGIAEGDLLVEVAGNAVTDADQLVEAISKVTFPLEVKLLRGTEERTVTVGGADASGEA
ncbi:MAG TPA: trypsin-like peptidase domain-containing protein [Candidatus Limnocylindrales bacterium]